MRLAYLIALAATLLPRLAHANECNVGQGFVAPGQVPLGCPLRVYYYPGAYEEPASPSDIHVLAQRGSSSLDVTGTVTALSTVAVPVRYDEPDTDNDCAPLYSTRDVDHDAFEVALPDVQVGDSLSVNGAYTGASVVPAGPCTYDLTYSLQCSAPIQDYQACRDEHGITLPGDEPATDDDGGGCATSSPASLAVGLALLALRRNRKTATP